MLKSQERPLVLACVAGTRPECLKLASIIRTTLHDPAFRTLVVSSGQHGEMVAATLRHLDLPLHFALPQVAPRTMLSRTVACLRAELTRWMQDQRPDVVMVQGDTSTAYAGALAASVCGIPLVHLEAGLRTSDPLRPFPEEHFRRSISPLCDLHLVPTAGARGNLLREGYASDAIAVVGNSIVDILRHTLATQAGMPPNWQAMGKRLLVLTLHRRENYQHGLVNVCKALCRLLELDPGLCLVCPVHPNPRVGAQIRRHLQAQPRVLLTQPLEYRDFIALIRQAALVVTDSGGIQEEAPYLGVPVLVARSETERPEALREDRIRLVACDEEAVLEAASLMLAAARPEACAFDANAPFGDGRTAERVSALLLQRYRNQCAVA